MQISRMDLDGKGFGSPEGLVRKILTLLPGLTIPVPIEELCEALDISRIEDFETDAFEGGLVTDTDRSHGIILARLGKPLRRRFTVAHELAHFLLPTHMPDAEGRFMCSREDLRRLTAKENDRRGRMEVEANRFSSLILIPPPMLQPLLKRNPGLSQVIELAGRFQVSREAMGRAYVQYHEKLLAVVFTKDGRVRYSVKGFRFPFITVGNGSTVPIRSLASLARQLPDTVSDFVECFPEVWIDPDPKFGKPSMYEQVLWQREGFAMVLLWLENLTSDDDEYENEDLTAKQRYAQQKRA